MFYAVAYDVAGGIHAWSGPHRWARARGKAMRWEDSECVSRAVVYEKLPSFNRRYHRKGCAVAM